MSTMRFSFNGFRRGDLPPARFWMASVWLVGLGLAGSTMAAPPTIKSLFPPTVSRGETVSVKIEGSYAGWPVTPLVDGEGVTVECEETKGQLKVTAAADAAPGVCLVRIADTAGISAARPLIVGVLPSQVEKEPNDTLEKSQPVANASIICGQLARSGDLDVFRLTLTHGQTLVAALQAKNVLGSPLDAVLQICTPDGFVLDQNDDERGLDPSLVFPVPADGDYMVRVFGFPETPNSTIGFAGGGDYFYRLTLTTGAYLDHTLPLAVPAQQPSEVEAGGWNLPPAQVRLPVAATTDQPFVSAFLSEAAGVVTLPVRDMACPIAAASSREQPQPLAVPSTVSGRLDGENREHVFAIEALKAKPLQITVEAYGLGYPLDPQVRVLDEAGKVLSEVDDVSKQFDSSLLFRAPADGTYRVVIRDLHGRGGTRFVYRMMVEESQPDVALTVKEDAYTVEVGKPLEVSVTVDRRAGFDKEIELTADGLPEGLTASVEKSAAKGDTAKLVKIKLTATAPCAAGRFRIVGRLPEDLPPRFATRADDALALPPTQLWVMAIAGK
jgi:hypothetical protein